MRFVLLFAVVFFNQTLYSQINQLTSIDDWKGSIDRYIIGENKLKLNALNAGSGAISKRILVEDTCLWRMSFEFNYSPSTSNQFRIYFLSDNRVDSMISHALYLEIGETGTEDGINLFSVKEGKTTLIDKLFLSEFSSAGKHDLVLRKTEDKFTLFIDGHAGYEFNMLVHESIVAHGYTGFQNEFTKSNVAGFLVHYLYFGDQVYQDLDVASVTYDDSKNDLEVSFNQGLAGLRIKRIEVSESQVPFSYVLDQGLLIMTFERGFETERSWSVLFCFENIAGALVNLQGDFWVYSVDVFDVIFTEVMFDYDSNTGYLHDGQYLELYNRSGHAIDLQKIQLQIDGALVSLPNYLLSAGDYVALMKGNVVDPKYLNVLPVSEWKNLGTSTGAVALFSGSTLVDHLQYDKQQFDDDFKQSGGWSIELVDIEGFCSVNKSWVFSENKLGGTPGKENSVKKFLDFERIKIEEVYFENDSQITLRFNVKLLLDESKFKSDLGIIHVEYLAGELNVFTVTFTSAMVRGRIYTMEVFGFNDCQDILIEGHLECGFGIPETAEPKDLIINEILADAISSNGDYIELYNNSIKVIDLSQVLIGVFNEGEQLVDTYQISDSRKLILPHRYLCLTKDIDQVKSNYLNGFQVDSLNVTVVKDMPNLPIEYGRVGVVNKSGQPIDVVHYAKSWHSDLIADTKGVSLERVYFNGETNDPTSWNSASYEVNYGTPGYANSNGLNGKVFQNGQSKGLYLVKDYIDLQNTAVNQGLRLQYEGIENGYVLTGVMYTSEGVKLAVFCENVLLGTSGELFFDIDDFPFEVRKASMCVVLFEAIHPEFKRIDLKQSVSVF